MVALSDTDSRQLVQAWRVETTVTPPQVSHNYTLTLPIGKVSQKVLHTALPVPCRNPACTLSHCACSPLQKLGYTNPWPTSRTFLVRSSDPTLLNIMEPRLVVAVQYEPRDSMVVLTSHTDSHTLCVRVWPPTSLVPKLSFGSVLLHR